MASSYGSYGQYYVQQPNPNYGAYHHPSVTTTTASNASLPAPGATNSHQYSNLEQYRYAQNSSQVYQDEGRFARHQDYRRDHNERSGYETSNQNSLAYQYSANISSSSRNVNEGLYSHPPADQPVQNSYQHPNQAFGHSNQNFSQQQARSNSANSVRSTQASTHSPQIPQAGAANRYQHSRRESNQPASQSHLAQQPQPHSRYQLPRSNPDVHSSQTAERVTSNITHNDSRTNRQGTSRSPRQEIARTAGTHAAAAERAGTTSQPAPAPATVDPTQVYNPYHEYEREVQRRQKEEASREAARKAAMEQEQRRQQESKAAMSANPSPAPQPPKSAKSSQLPAAERQPPKSARGQDKKPTPAKPEHATKTTKNKSSKTAKRKSATGGGGHTSSADEDGATAAARTLVETANSKAAPALETEIQAMFRKMREFNEKDPELLAKLWNQEREEFQAAEQAKAAAAAQQSPAGPKSKPKAASKNKSTTVDLTGSQSQPSPSSNRKAAARAPSRQIAGTTPLTPSALAQPQPTAYSSQHTQPISHPAPAQISPQVPVTPIPPPEEQPPPPPKRTIWPAAKKAALSAAAAKFLNAIPMNYGKSIQPAQISAILDEEPTYVELCKGVERLGVTFDYGRFAKALLIAVPDVNSKPQQNKETNATSPTIKKTPTESVQPQYAGMALSGNVTLSETLAEAEAQLLDDGNVLSAPAKPKASKRKDGVSAQVKKKPSEGLVQMTPSNLESFRSTERNTPIDPRLEGLDAVKQYVDGPVAATVPQTEQPAPRAATRERDQNSAAAPPPATKQEAARKRAFGDLVDLTKLSDDEEDGAYPPFKRQETDIFHDGQGVKTEITGFPVAVNKGQNLQQRQQQQVPSPAAPSVKLMPLDHPARGQTLAQEIDRYKAIRRSTYDARTIARDVLLACGRHPDMRHLNAHLETLKVASTTVKDNSDLGTFRWDLVDPGGPPPGSGAERPIIANVIDAANDADDESDDVDRGHPSAEAPPRQSVSIGGGTVAMSGPNALPRGLASDKANIGRPLARRSDPATRTVPSGHNSSPAPRGRPRKSAGLTREAAGERQKSEGGQAPGYAELRAATGGAKRGRPVGWRKWMQKAPGAKPSKAPTTKTQPEPVYQVYQCQWKGCGAELHNLRTLRKHIHKLHAKRQEDGSLSCEWNGCGRVVSKTDQATQRTTSSVDFYRFAQEDEWKEHIEKKHLTPIAWKLGDGPADGSSDQRDSELSEAYMSDNQGRRVAPRITAPEQQAEPSKKRGAEEKARELQREAELRKQEIGPGVDRGGARLVNEKRRQGFVDDDDTMEIISEDDEE